QKELLQHVLAMACLSAMLGLAGCEEKGSAEKAGQQVDRAVENAEQKIDQAKDQAEKEIDAAKESVTDKAQSAGEYVDDAAITARVKSAILTDPLLKGASIEVTTVNGVVTLRGTVNTEPSIARAIEVANAQRDVKGVQSELVVQVK
ncbi:MAG: BON domain-containing protein, partial [Methylobacter sp.]